MGWASTEEGRQRQQEALAAGRAKRAAKRSQEPAEKSSAGGRRAAKAQPGDYGTPEPKEPKRGQQQPKAGRRTAGASRQPSRRQPTSSRGTASGSRRAAKDQPRRRGFLDGLFGGG